MSRGETDGWGRYLLDRTLVGAKTPPARSVKDEDETIEGFDFKGMSSSGSDKPWHGKKGGL